MADENRSSEIGGAEGITLVLSDIVPDSNICQPDTPANNQESLYIITIAEANIWPP